jgi:hypothetical protein
MHKNNTHHERAAQNTLCHFGGPSKSIVAMQRYFRRTYGAKPPETGSTTVRQV